MDTAAPTFQHTDTEVIVRLRKTSDLDLKVYNPAFMQSLGLIDVSVSLVDEEGSTIPMTGGGNGAASTELTFPYNQFVYMIRRDTEHVDRTEQPEQSSFNPFAQLSSFVKQKMSGVKNPFISKQTPPAPYPATSLEAAPSTVKPAEPNVSIQTSPTAPITTPISPPPLSETTPISPPPSQVNATQPIPISIPDVATQPPPPPPSTPFGLFSQTLNTITAPNKTQLELEGVPEKMLFWKIVIPKASNPERIMDAEFWGDLNEEWFNDVKHLASIEKKWGVFIQGEFYTILGRKCKFGSVVKWENQNSLIDYLEHTVFLENTIVDKYYRAYLISNPSN